MLFRNFVKCRKSSERNHENPCSLQQVQRSCVALVTKRFKAEPSPLSSAPSSGLIHRRLRPRLSAVYTTITSRNDGSIPIAWLRSVTQQPARAHTRSASVNATLPSAIERAAEESCSAFTIERINCIRIGYINVNIFAFNNNPISSTICKKRFSITPN